MTRERLIKLIIAGGVYIIVLAVLIILMVRTTPQEKVGVNGVNNLGYSVYYVENSFFGGGEASKNINYLLPYTDYITISNDISFSDDPEITCVLDVTQIYTINSQSGSENTVVYEERTEIEKQRDVIKDGAEGEYVVNPWEHIDTYIRFDEDKQIQAEAREASGKNASYYAELSMEFKYTIRYENATETFTRVIAIPLSNEVYQPSISGDKSFHLFAGDEGLGKIHESPRTLIIIILMLWFTVPVLIFGYYSKKKKDKEQNRSEADMIFGKYSDIIIQSIKPLNISEYSVIFVSEFKELVKLSAGLNKSILSFKHTKETDSYKGEAEFCVYDDATVYCYCTGIMTSPQKQPAAAENERQMSWEEERQMAWQEEEPAPWTEEQPTTREEEHPSYDEQQPMTWEEEQPADAEEKEPVNSGKDM